LADSITAAALIGIGILRDVAGRAIYANNRGGSILKKYAIVCFMAVVLLALSGCSDGEKLELPTYAELQSITIREFEGENALSREISLNDYLSTRKSYSPNETYFYTQDYRKINKETQIPVKDNSIAIKFTETDENMRLFYVYNDDKYNYIEEAGVGVWRDKLSKTVVSEYEYLYDTYQNESFLQAFGNQAADKEFALLPEYNGSGKAIWLDISEGKADDWISRFIPDDLAAKRAEDVRYVVLCELVSKVYEGYWYVPETGERLDDSYDLSYKASIYDLVTGESTVLINETYDIFAIPDYIESYFSEK
jgi:hypothetical protein